MAGWIRIRAFCGLKGGWRWKEEGRCDPILDLIHRNPFVAIFLLLSRVQGTSTYPKSFAKIFDNLLIMLSYRLDLVRTSVAL